MLSTGQRSRSETSPVAAPQLRAVEFAQRDGGHAHLVSVGARQEAQPEDLEAVARGHAVHILVDGADQHLPPEALDGAGRLPLLAQPVEHGDAVEVVAAGALAPQRQQAARDGQILSAALRKRRRRNDSVKCRGAGSAPRRSVEIRPPGSMK
jgi:hypothetical protein